MTIKEFGECIEYNIQHNIKHAILGLGAPGVGKSQLIRQIGKKYGSVPVFLAKIQAGCLKSWDMLEFF